MNGIHDFPHFICRSVVGVVHLAPIKDDKPLHRDVASELELSLVPPFTSNNAGPRFGSRLAQCFDFRGMQNGDFAKWNDQEFHYRHVITVHLARVCILLHSCT
jgi:hypothetical protein